MSHRARWIVGSVVLAAAATYALVGNPLDPFDNRRFSPEAWRDAGEHHDNHARARMCGDLMNRVIRPGMSEKQVVTLLGSPYRVRDTRCPDNAPLPDRRLYEYPIGSWTFHRMDDAFLFVHIDQTDHVITAEICGY
jgi:hypothetical protein